MENESGYVLTRGARIYREVRGEGDPVVLLHGGLGTIGDFKFQTPELAKHFRVVSFERPGHGRSEDTNEEFNYQTMKEYTIAFLEGLGLGPCNLVGWSDGGIVALLVAIYSPGLVRRLVPISANFNTEFYDAATRRSIESESPQSFRENRPEFIKQYDDATPEGPVRFPIQFERTKRMWLTQPDISREDLAKIIAPTLVMAADHDAIPIEHTVRLFQSIRGAQLCVVPGTTHFLLSERPQAVNSLIVDFLKGNR